MVFRVIFEGGCAGLDKSVSGLENLTLDLALHGSPEYSYEQIQQLEYEKSFSFSSAVGKDYSTAGFICIQRDLSQVFDIFSDCMLNPLFSDDDFNRRMTEIKDDISRKKSDPSGALSNAITKNVFKDHPYATTSSATEESYPNINMSLIRGLHQSLLNALRIKIVVVGNFSSSLIDDFTSSLESRFGGVSRKAYTLPVIPKISVASQAVRIPNEQAGEAGYVAGLFECPPRNSEDYIPFALAALYIDDLFFSQVREQAGALYSISTGVTGGKELSGVITAYRVSERSQLKKLILDAISSFDASTLEKKLDQYKNKYISMIFDSAQTASGVASSVISSIEYLGSESEYLRRAEAVRAVDAGQVVNAYTKYFEPISRQDAACWIIVDSEKNLDSYDF